MKKCILLSLFHYLICVNGYSQTWTPIGPIDFSTCSAARVMSHWVDENNPKHIIIGTSTSGIWEGFDNSLISGIEKWEWNCLTDNQIRSCSVKKLAVNPINNKIIYAAIAYGYNIGIGGIPEEIIFTNDGGINWFHEAVPNIYWEGIKDLRFIPNSQQLIIITKNEIYSKITNSIPLSFAATLEYQFLFPSTPSPQNVDPIGEVEFSPNPIPLTGQNFAVVPQTLNSGSLNLRYNSNGISNWNWQTINLTSGTTNNYNTGDLFWSDVSIAIPDNQYMWVLARQLGCCNYTWFPYNNDVAMLYLYDYTSGTPTFVKQWLVSLQSDYQESKCANSKFRDLTILNYKDTGGNDHIKALIGLDQNVLLMSGDIDLTPTTPSQLAPPLQSPNLPNLTFNKCFDYFYHPSPNSVKIIPTSVHTDIRSLSFCKTNKSIYITNDGGISRCDNFCNSMTNADWKTLNGHGLNISEFGGFDHSEFEKYGIAASGSDGGSYYCKKNTSGILKFTLQGSGDRHRSAILKSSGNLAIMTENGNGYPHPTNFQGDDFSNINNITELTSTGLPSVPGAHNADMNSDADNYSEKPFEFDDNDNFYTGTTDMFVTSNAFIKPTAWQQLSSSSSKNTNTAPIITNSPIQSFKYLENFPSQNLTTIYFSTINKKTANDPVKLIKCVTNKINIPYTYTYTDITPINITNSLGVNLLDVTQISDIVIDDNNPNKIWVSFGSPLVGPTYGWPGVIESGGICFSSDGGNTWTNISTGLPASSPIHCLEYWKGTSDIVFAGTEEGVYVFNKNIGNNGSWSLFNDNTLPRMCPISEIKVHECSGNLRVSSFRGLWESPLNPSLITIRKIDEIQSNQVWNTSKFLKNDIRIKSGNTLKIEKDVNGLNVPVVISVNFGHKFIIEQGAKLEIDGSVLTNECDGMWEGIEVENGGELKLINGAELHHFNKITVDDNGIFDAQQGSLTVVDDNSIIEVKQGGKLIMGNGNVQLNGSNASVYIKGTLEIPANTDLTLNGTGFYQFGVGNNIVLNQGSKVDIVGSSRNYHNMIKIDDQAKIMVQNHNVKFEQGRIVYGLNSKIEVHGGGSLEMNNLTTVNYGVTAPYKGETAIDVSNTHNVLITNCIIDDFVDGVKVHDYALDCMDPNGRPFVKIENCNFNLNNNSDIKVNNMQNTNVLIQGCTMANQNNTCDNGLDLSHCNKIEVTSTIISNKQINGIKAEHVNQLLVNSTHVFSNLSNGIEANNANIYVRNGSVVELNVNDGISLNNGGSTMANATSSLTIGDWGCAWIIHNGGYAINGSDFFLYADAKEHSILNGSIIKPNRFDDNSISTGTGMSINICYTAPFWSDHANFLVLSSTTLKYNYWGGSNNRFIGHIALQPTGGLGCNFMANLPVTFADDGGYLTSLPVNTGACTFTNFDPNEVAPYDPTNISGRMSHTPVEIPQELIDLTLASEEPAGKIFSMAYRKMLENNIDEATFMLTDYLSVADPSVAPDSRFETTQALADKLAIQLYALDPCTSPYDPSQPQARKAKLNQIKESISKRKSSGQRGISIYPNPFETKTTISFNNDVKETFVCTVYNMQGQSVKTMQSIESSSFTIDASMMPKGMYWIELKSKTKSYREKLVVE